MPRSGPTPASGRRGPLTDTELGRLAELHGQGQGCNEIARALGRSAATISIAAKKLGLSFTRDQVKAATEARQIDLAAARAQLAADLMGDAQRLRERAWSKYKVVVSGGEGADIIELPLPPLPDTRHAYQAIGICIDKALRLAEVDSDPANLPAVDQWLRSMMGI